MATILIVDDETLTREGIKSSIEWNEIGIRTVLTAKNGVDALKVLNGAPLDILLTDVRMPQMDGIALAKHIRAEYPDCAILFLSGFSDEPYLRSAIDVKAEHYIDKPVDVDALGEALGEVMERLNARWQVREQVARAESRVLGGLMQNTRATAADIEEALLAAGRANEAGLAWTCALFFFAGWEDTPPEDWSHIVWVEEQLAAGLASAGFGNLVHIGQGNTAVCFVCHPHTAQAAQQLHQQFKALQSSLQPRPVVAVGGPVPSAGQAPQACAQARRALQRLYYHDDEAFFEEKPQKPWQTIHLDEAVAALPPLLAEGSYTQAREGILQVYRLLADQQPPLSLARGCFQYILQQLVRCANQSAGVWADSPLSSVGAFDEVASARQATEILLDMLADLEEGVSGSAGNRIAEDAMALISRELENPNLSITLLCERLAITAPYLCFVFKRQTGNTINHTITHLRMETAKTLLQNPSLKIHEIAARCGFNSTNYFTRAFKKNVGMLPTRYRAERPE